MTFSFGDQLVTEGYREMMMRMTAASEEGVFGDAVGLFSFLGL